VQRAGGYPDAGGDGGQIDTVAFERAAGLERAANRFGDRQRGGQRSRGRGVPAPQPARAQTHVLCSFAFYGPDWLRVLLPGRLMLCV